MTMEQNAQPIRVAQMMTDMNYGGVEMVVMNYYRHMDRSRVQFDFFALEGSTLPAGRDRTAGRPGVCGAEIYHLPQYEQEIGRLFRQNGYQIVHSHMNTLSVLSLWGAKRAGVPTGSRTIILRWQGRRSKKCDEVPAPSLCHSVSQPGSVPAPERQAAGFMVKSLSGCSTMPLSLTALLMMPPNGKPSGRSLAWGINWCWAMSDGSAMPKITNFCWM